jgi:hypothetical protein
MYICDAEHVRQHRPPLGMPAGDRFPATELQRLEQPPWPRNRLGEPASIAELMAESTHAGENDNVAWRMRMSRRAQAQ